MTWLVQLCYIYMYMTLYVLKPHPLLSQGSGSNVDICIITADKTEYIRPFDVANKKGERYIHTCVHTHTRTHTHAHTHCRSREYKYRRGTTAVLETTVREFEVTSETVSSAAEAMES